MLVIEYGSILGPSYSCHHMHYDRHFGWGAAEFSSWGSGIDVSGTSGFDDFEFIGSPVFKYKGSRVQGSMV